MKKIISNNRSFIMGIAILWVALYHLPIKEGNIFNWFISEIGYGGVDIFIFLSGFGLYYSLDKCSDVTEYMKKRMKRLLPSYIPFIIIWMIIRKVTYQLYFTEIFGNLTMTGWWNQDSNQFNWYVDGILVLYIIAPYIYGFIKKSRNKALAISLFFLLAMSISFGFFHGKLLIAVSRLPVFVLGMGAACLLSQKKDVREIWKKTDGKTKEICIGNDIRSTKIGFLLEGYFAVLFWNILMFAGLFTEYYFMKLQNRFDLWHYGLWWYPFIIIVPGLCMDLGFLGELLSKNRFTGYIEKLISSFGEASFEIFLIHLFIFETAQAKWISGILIWTILFISSFALGYIYYYLINRKLLPLFDRRRLK